MATNPRHSFRVRRNKYKAIKVVDPVDGKFDSKAEYARWLELKAMEKAGEVQELRRQVPYPLEVDGKLVGKYVADFVYCTNKGFQMVVEDVKGIITPMFRWKEKHLKIQYGIDITIIGKVAKKKKKRP